MFLDRKYPNMICNTIDSMAQWYMTNLHIYDWVQYEFLTNEDKNNGQITWVDISNLIVLFHHDITMETEYITPHVELGSIPFAH